MYSKTREIIKTFTTSTTRPAARVGAIHTVERGPQLVSFTITFRFQNKLQDLTQTKPFGQYYWVFYHSLLSAYIRNVHPFQASLYFE